MKQVVCVALADILFGDDGFSDGSFIVPCIMTFIATLLALTWSRYRKAIKRQVDSIGKKTQEIEEQWLTMTVADPKPTLANIRAYLKKLDSLITLVSAFRDQEMVKNLNARREEVEAMLVATKKHPKAKSTASRQMML